MIGRSEQDPRLAVVQESVVEWQAQCDRLTRSHAPFHEWRRLQFEARRAFIIAQRAYIKLHGVILGRLKSEPVTVPSPRLVQDVHREMLAFEKLLRMIDENCR